MRCRAISVTAAPTWQGTRGLIGREGVHRRQARPCAPRMIGVQRIVLIQMAAAVCEYQDRLVADDGIPARRGSPSHVAGPGRHA